MDERRLRAFVLAMSDYIQNAPGTLTPILKISLVGDTVRIDICQGAHVIYNADNDKKVSMGITPFCTNGPCARNVMFMRLAKALGLPATVYGFMFLWSSSDMLRMYFIGTYEGQCYIRFNEDCDDNEKYTTYLDYARSCQAILDAIQLLGPHKIEIYKFEWSNDYLPI
jgi:hypothetical protein